MTTFAQATLHLRPGGSAEFMATMARVVPIVEAAGWRLVGGYVQKSGRLHTVIDLWELEDLNHYDRGLRALAGHPDFPELAAALARTVESETIVFADKAPYAH